MQIEKAADWDLVNEALLGFEDGLIRETWLESGRWLQEDDSVNEPGHWTAAVLVQLQSAPTRAFLLWFDGVTSIEFLANRDVTPANAHDLDTGWHAAFLGCRVTATRCRVEPLGEEWVGRGPFLTDRARLIPSSKA